MTAFFESDDDEDPWVDPLTQAFNDAVDRLAEEVDEMITKGLPMTVHSTNPHTDSTPPRRGIVVRLVGGDLHGLKWTVPNLDDHVHVFIPFRDAEGHAWELMYSRRLDEKGAWYGFVTAVPDLGPRKKAVD